MGVPQGSIPGPDLFTILFVDKVTPTATLCHEWIWAASSAAEYISGSPPLSSLDRAVFHSREGAIFARGSASVPQPFPLLYLCFNAELKHIIEMIIL